MRRGSCWILGLFLVGCGGNGGAKGSSDGGALQLTPVDGAFVDGGGTDDAESPDAATDATDANAGNLDANPAHADHAVPDAASAIDAAPEATTDAGPLVGFVTSVVSYDPGPCGGYGSSRLPGVVLGPPDGAGSEQGSYDVVSLGDDGTIVLGFAPDEIVDGPGPDFIVFENTFDYGTNERDAEPGEVSVSEDAVNWVVFPCHDTSSDEPAGGWTSTECAGLAPVFSNPNNGISPTDVAKAGGDAFDLKDVGVTKAKFVRIRSVIAGEACTATGPNGGKNGFDLDAIAIVHGSLP